MSRMRWLASVATATIVLSAAIFPAPALGASTSSAPATPRPPCPNADGGACLGPLTAGTHTSWVFWTPITYTVTDGWDNEEDLPGNFLLLPPGSTLDGVDSGTSDFVGIYQGVAVAAENCEEAPEAGVATSAEAMAAALAGRDGLDVSDALPVQLGRLSGLTIDVTYAPGSDNECRDPYFPLPFVPLIVGTGPADLSYSAFEGFTTRLYLLDDGDTNIVIEVLHTAAAPGTLDDYEPFIESIDFGPTP